MLAWTDLRAGILLLLLVMGLIGSGELGFASHDLVLIKTHAHNCSLDVIQFLDYVVI